MLGHGCPNIVCAFRAKKCFVVFAFTAALILSQSYSFAQQGYSGDPVANVVDRVADASVSTTQASAIQDNIGLGRFGEQIRLRFSWGGGSAQTWSGKITVSQGSFSNVAPLGLTSDAPADVALVDGDVLIRHGTTSNYGGGDVTLAGGPKSQVSIVLSSIETPEAKFERTFTFDELTAGTIGGEIDLLGNRCSVTRVPGDSLGVTFERDHLVFEPGEPFTFSIKPNLTGLLTRTANCRVKLVPAHQTGLAGSRTFQSKTLSFQLDENGSSDPQEVQLEVPSEESIFNVEVELESNWYQSSFAKKKVVRRSIQLLVLGKRPDNIQTQGWKRVSTFDPDGASHNSFPSLSQLSRMAGLSEKNTLGNEHLSRVVINNQTMTQLAPGGWQAIPLSVDRINKPHIVELEYLAGGEMAFGVSVLQPDASGQIPLYGFDSGVFIPRAIVSGSEDSETIKTHRLTIWPNTKTPFLLVANRHASATATVGKVSVFAGPDRLQPSEIAARPNRSSRKLMAFYEAPLFPENFGAPEKVDPSVAEPLDDWRTFYEGAERLIQYLKANSYQGAFVTVACEGSSIYPSQLLSPSPKHDNGTFFSSGQDPIRKDILEMLFRMFEREGLVLVPALAFSSPIPEVEAIRKRDGESEFDLIDLNRTQRKASSTGQLPIYNPLSRRVQRAVTRVVEELSDRYKSYSSFDGVAMVCRPDTYTLLPGRQWGYDQSTIQQFIQSQSDLTTVPAQWSEVQDILLGSHREQWVDWRASQMTQWYESIATAIQRSIPEGRLYIAPVDLYRNEETASALSPSLHASSDFAEVMLHLGFAADEKRTSTDNKIVLLNPHRIAPEQSLSSQRVDLAVEDSEQAQQYFTDAGYTGDLFTHRISWAHFAQLQAQSPFGEQQNLLMRLQQMTPAEGFNRQRFVQSVKNRDSRMLVDGGVMVTMGQEESIADLIQVFSQLPDKRFEDVVSTVHANSEHLAVRQLRSEFESMFYVANASPWPTRVKLLVMSSGDVSTSSIESLSSQPFQIRTMDKPLSVENQEGENQVGENHTGANLEITIEVPAYGLVGGRAIAGMNVSDFSFELPENAGKKLRRHVYALQSKLLKSGNPVPLRVIENSSFEINGRPTLAGWDSGQQPTGNVRLNTDQDLSSPQAQAGRGSLLMANETDTPVWVRSNSFEAAETGRLSISVWLRTSDPSTQPPLRLAIEGQSKGSSYYRYGSIGGLSPDPSANQVESQWKRFAVHFDDLPVDGLSNIRIGFDLMGPGEVNIDNVQVFDRWFDENDAKAMTQMLASTGPLLSRHESFDRCRRLLEGYWPRFLDHFIDSDDVITVKEAEPVQVGNAATNDLQLINGSVGGEKENRKSQLFRRFRRVPSRKPTIR